MKKYFKFSIIFLLLLSLQSCHIGRFFIWNFADADDYKKFDNIAINNAGSPFEFIDATTTSNQLFLPEKLKEGKKEYEFEKALEKSRTVAFMVIRNDSILYEKYFDGRTEESIHPSFSAVKSIVSLLVGIAVDEGKIQSVHDPITNYLPELDNGKGFEKITIEHLLDMRAGIKYNEGYFNPFGNVAKYYYGKNIKKYLPQLKIKEAPDQKFEYISINTQLLALIVEKATQTSIAHYLEDKVWKRLGMEYPALWSIDSEENQTAKAFCCLNARTRDFAKIGRLYLNNGNWNGTQIVSEEWVRKSTEFDEVKNNFDYTYQWWHTRRRTTKTDSTEIPELYYEKEVVVNENGKDTTKTFIYSPYPDFYALGFMGQFIYMYPEKDIIIVRLGEKSGKVNWLRLFWDIAEEN